MKQQVLPNLLFSDETHCSHDVSGTIAVVHACKEPCHRYAVGYSAKSLPNTHPHYLAMETEYHLYLNLIDPPAPLFMMPSFVAFFAFVDKHIAEREVLIHCNQGQSRAPSLALLYAAKRMDRFSNSSYAEAAQAFRAEFPYNPGRGIQSWLVKNWTMLG